MARLTTRPDYGEAADGWARGATLVYGPLADVLLDLLDDDGWADRRVLDLGAGTGAVSTRLLARGAHPVALDLSPAMLAHDRAQRVPAVAADVLRLPLRAASVDAAAASFVLNHVDDPHAALRELVRCLRPGAPVVASVFAATSSHPRRDLIDEVASRWGWEPPTWYLDIKANAVPLLAHAPAMAEAAGDAGLVDVRVEERAVDVGVTSAAQLVEYRLGQAHVAAFLGRLPAADRARLRAEAVDAVGEPMEPYRPTVVLLAARRPPTGPRPT